MIRFTLEAFIEECVAAAGAPNASSVVREIVARAVSEPAAVIAELGEPSTGGIKTFYHTADLTVLDVTWSPKMTLQPHDHRMWAVIGVYGGREDNIFWKRLPGAEPRVEAAGAKSLCERDAAILGPDIVHSVTNPIPRFTTAIHVYGGDFFGVARSQWNPETLREEPFDATSLLQQFADDNRRWFATQ
jgi:predicted metal-dependent enzyme (double-stranded beta helix superfamily)